ncbi:hypothetical protein [Streptomyces sp. NPDC056948]|uniref:hypothetical protein n=1 Tax=Streptomyces sp. NPDC056948 TaxID=3345975 RepID=UPI0036336C68
MTLPDNPQGGSGRDVDATAILKLVVAEASFIAALMFYVGLIYTNRYCRNFHLSPSSLGFGFSEYVVESLQVLSRPVLSAVVALLLLTSAPHFVRRLPLTSRLRRRAAAMWDTVAGQYWLVVAVGFALFLLWRVEPYWAAPATVAAGLLMGQSRAALRGRGQGLLERAVPLFAAMAFLLLAITLLAAQLGDREAKQAARHVVRWPGVILFSTERLSLTGPSGLRPTILARARICATDLAEQRCESTPEWASGGPHSCQRGTHSTCPGGASRVEALSSSRQFTPPRPHRVGADRQLPLRGPARVQVLSGQIQ